MFPYYFELNLTNEYYEKNLVNDRRKAEECKRVIYKVESVKLFFEPE